MSSQRLERKRFVAYFAEGFPSGERALVANELFFSDTNGYRPEELRAIRKLKVDEVFKSSVSVLHKVWRVR